MIAKRILAGAIASALMVQGGTAAACVPLVTIDNIPPTSAEIDLALMTCRAAHERKDDYLEGVRQGLHSLEEALEFSERLLNHQYGCLVDRQMAFRIVEAAIPDPLPADLDQQALWRVNSLMLGNEHLASPERVRDLAGRYWLTGGYEPRGWSAEDMESYLLEPANWEVSLRYLGTYRANLPSMRRQWLMFSHMTDPDDRYFDLVQAAEMARQTAWVDDDMVVARRLLDGERDIESLRRASAMLEWYSPAILPFGAGSFDQARGHVSLLASALLESPDPIQRRQGQQLLDNLEQVAVGERSLPDLPDLVEAGSWREHFSDLNVDHDRVIARLGDNYPSRAIRREVTGVAESALLFGPDGRFRQVWITRSSGSEVLDQSLVQGFERYLRPRLTDLTLPDRYAGKNVLVDLPAMAWRLDDNLEEY